MAQPPEYQRLYSFTDYQSANPDDPLPGDKVDGELNRVKQTSDAVRTNLAKIQRDDGALANESVGAEQIKSSVSLGINKVEDWQSGTAYQENDGVWENRKLYRCVAAHTSTTFSSDLSAGNWSEIVDHDQYVSVAETKASEASASASESANNAQNVVGGAFAFPVAIELVDTADSDPGSGKLKFDNATQNAATTLYVDDLDAAGVNIASLLAAVDDSTSTQTAQISIRKRTDRSKVLYYAVTAYTAASGYSKVTVSHVDGSGANPFSDGDEVIFGFTRTGDKGDKGDKGDQGPQGLDGAQSFDWTTVTGAGTDSADDRVLADTSGGAFTRTLPASPSTGASVWYADPGESWGTNNLTVSGNGNNVEGAGTFTANVDGGAFECVYNGTQWRVRFASGV